MKTYPSIDKCREAPNVDAFVFKKYDGSNFRAEFSAKRSWYKFGSRTKLVDLGDSVFGEAIQIFLKDIGDKVLADTRLIYGGKSVDGMTVFAEFFGKHSFAGHHLKDDPKCLKVFDINLHKKGFVDPASFIMGYGIGGIYADIIQKDGFVKFIDNDFVENTKQGKYNSEGEEGVVCKWKDGKEIRRLKIKTRSYLEKLKNRFGEDWTKYD